MEVRDLYDKDRNLTGETILKGEQIPENRYIIVMLIFIQNSEGKFLIQKRSKQKMDFLPLLVDMQKLVKLVFKQYKQK